MTPEFKNLLALLESKDEQNIKLALLQLQNYPEEFKTHFGIEWSEPICNLIEILLVNGGWDMEIPLLEITELRLSQKGLTSIPREIGKLQKLESLELDYNQIVEIPKEIGLLKKMEYLDLSHNQILKILTEISLLQNLRDLVLHHNQIIEIPREIELLKKLEYLNLHNNQIVEIPKEIGLLKKLVYLNLAGNPIENTDEIKTLLPNCEIIF